MEQTECSETSEYKIQTPGNYPEENIKHTGHGESLKSRTLVFLKKKKITNLLKYIKLLTNLSSKHYKLGGSPGPSPPIFNSKSGDERFP